MSIVCDGIECYIFTPNSLNTPYCKVNIYSGGHVIYQSNFLNPNTTNRFITGLILSINTFYEMDFELYLNNITTNIPYSTIPKFPVLVTCSNDCYISGGKCQFISDAQNNCDTDEQYLFWTGSSFLCKNFPDYSCDVGQVTTEPSTGNYACQSTNCPDGQYYSYPDGCLSFPCNIDACSSETIDNLC